MFQKLSVAVSFSALVLAVLGDGGCSDPGPGSGAAGTGSGSALSGASTSGSLSPSGSTTGSIASGSSGSVQTGGATSGSSGLATSGSPRDGGSDASSSGLHRPDAATSGSSSGSTKPDASTSGSSTHSGSSSGSANGNRCADASLTWKSGNKTNYQSYPDPNSPECTMFGGCMYRGQFSACPGITETQQWVMSHNIVSVFPLGQMALHDLCLRLGNNTIVVTVLDTCNDSDCNGCCTQNRGTADALIDIEQYTDFRWGVNDGAIEWADLGVTTGSGCN